MSLKSLIVDTYEHDGIKPIPGAISSGPVELPPGVFGFAVMELPPGVFGFGTSMSSPEMV